MIDVEEALSLVGRHARRLPTMSVSLREALDLRLAEAIASAVDSPPFDKSMLDGYAVRANDLTPTRRVLAEVIAGEMPRQAVGPGTTVRLMTGAPLPDGADAVVKHEETRPQANDIVEMPAAPIAVGAGVLPRGASFHAGQEVLPAGKWLTPVDIGLLAEMGRDHVPVTPRPRVAVLATGNELVQCGEPVRAAQIRNSNGPMLLAALEQSGAATADLGIARDDRQELAARIEQGLEADALLVTGGVSAGVMDLVPGVLAELGVAEVFHKVRMKPGKPLWFGVRESADRQTLVFGLPGNPVSTLVSLVLFVNPALRALAGGEFAPAAQVRGTLAKGVDHRGGRPTYHPCRIEWKDGQRIVEPLTWRGSADLAALTRANALIVLPAGDYVYSASHAVDLIPLAASLRLAGAL